MSFLSFITFFYSFSCIIFSSAVPVPILSTPNAFDKFADSLDPIRKAISKVTSPVGDLISDVISPLTGDTKFTNNEQTSTVSALDVNNTLVTPALFSNIAYCSPDLVKSWTCGTACDTLPGVEVSLTGGNNEYVPYFFVAHDPNSQSVILSTQGTDPVHIQSLLVDIMIEPSPLNKTFFPDAPNNVRVHGGFQDAFEVNAKPIEGEVKRLLAEKKVNKVLITGHSLGAAISVLHAIHLRRILPKEISIQTTIFGLPRAGNTAWAKFVDKSLGIGQQFIHMHVGHDFVPTIPPRTFLDYHHPSGEVYDSLSGSGPVDCPGQENNNCSASNNALEIDLLDHLGPYAGVRMGSLSCPS